MWIVSSGAGVAIAARHLRGGIVPTVRLTLRIGLMK